MCVFCRIVAGELPASVIHKGRHVVAILDINPINKGHTLVISKKHYPQVTEVPDEVLCEAITVAKLIAAKMKANLKAEGINLFQTNGSAAGQEIEHFHLHVIPRFKNDGTKFRFSVKRYTSEEEKETIKKLLEVK